VAGGVAAFYVCKSSFKALSPRGQDDFAADVAVPQSLRLRGAGKKMDIDWKADVAESKSIVPIAWGWVCQAILLAVQSYMVSIYAPSFSVASYIYRQLACIAYSWVATKYVFPKVPTIAGLPFFLIAFAPALLICALPFLGPFGAEFAQNAPIWVLCAWSAVRLMFESIVQMHANYGVKGVSNWLRWPIQKADQPYTLTYPLIGKVTRTHGGNVDAFSSLTVGLPVALFSFIMNNDSNPTVQMVAWAAQIWMFVYLCVLGPVPHFLGGMPGPNNIFDFDGTPKEKTGMHALTSGTLGTCCFWIASYAVIHFIVFVRKLKGI